MNMPNVHTKSVSNTKRFLFYGIAMCIPVAFFALLEGGLRLVGYGNDTPLFIENPANPHYLLPRPDVMSRYFPPDAPQPNVTLEANFFLKEKPENGIRLFVQGGSTAAGFPYGYGASLAATLDQRLKQALPANHVEVVGTALSAVNSYTLLDLADEIIEQSPDGVLIYAGHNEFLGILGVGSSFALANSTTSTLWFIKLKGWRTFQLIQRLFFNISSPSDASLIQMTSKDPDASSQAGTANSRTLMSKVAKDKNIAKDSALFDAGIHQFERNMRLLIQKYQSANIPVFIASLASNQGQQAPFSSAPASLEHMQIIKGIESLLSQTKRSDAIPAQLQLIQTQLQHASAALMSSDSADLHFTLARYLRSLGLHSLAKTHFMQAIEHDTLRFRAPKAINDVISKLSEMEGVYWVDSKTAFEQRSRNGIIDTSLMLEHLHPNLEGYFVLSESFYQALRMSKRFSPWTDIAIGQAWNERLILPAEEYFGYATIQKLTSDYPFVDQPVKVKLAAPTDWQQELGYQWFSKQLTWEALMHRSLNRYRSEQNQAMAQKTLQILADALPHNGLYNLQLAELMLKQNRDALALHYFKRAKLAGAVGDNLDKQVHRLREQQSKLKVN
ncbi:hypothetical protein PN836_004640 [Ningiella sp. W23]|uniref:hypothetical protein n=1 Tax=Ningiella sp. W23 TaxID=3023715 RepID=UPI0037571EFF